MDGKVEDGTAESRVQTIAIIGGAEEEPEVDGGTGSVISEEEDLEDEEDVGSAMRLISSAEEEPEIDGGTGSVISEEEDLEDVGSAVLSISSAEEEPEIDRGTGSVTCEEEDLEDVGSAVQPITISSAEEEMEIDGGTGSVISEAEDLEGVGSAVRSISSAEKDLHDDGVRLAVSDMSNTKDGLDDNVRYMSDICTGGTKANLDDGDEYDVARSAISPTFVSSPKDDLDDDDGARSAVSAISGAEEGPELDDDSISVVSKEDLNDDDGDARSAVSAVCSTKDDLDDELEVGDDDDVRLAASAIRSNSEELKADSLLEKTEKNDDGTATSLGQNVSTNSRGEEVVEVDAGAEDSTDKCIATNIQNDEGQDGRVMPHTETKPGLLTTINLFITGIIAESKVRELFSAAHKLEFHNHPKRCFCFAKYYDANAARDAYKKGQSIEGINETVTVDFPIETPDDIQRFVKNADMNNEVTLYVGGFHVLTKQEDIQELFPTATTVLFPQLNRGFCFAVYDNEAMCKEAYEKSQGLVLNNAALMIDYAKHTTEEINELVEITGPRYPLRLYVGGSDSALEIQALFPTAKKIAVPLGASGYCYAVYTDAATAYEAYEKSQGLTLNNIPLIVDYCEMKALLCNKCRSLGHMSHKYTKKCPGNCFTCGESGHVSSQCKYVAHIFLTVKNLPRHMSEAEHLKMFPEATHVILCRTRRGNKRRSANIFFTSRASAYEAFEKYNETDVGGGRVTIKVFGAEDTEAPSVLNVSVCFTLESFADLLHLKPFIQRSMMFQTTEIDGITFVSLAYSTYHYKDDLLKLKEFKINGKKLSQFQTHNIPEKRRRRVRVNNLPATVEMEQLNKLFPNALKIKIENEGKCHVTFTFHDISDEERDQIKARELILMQTNMTMNVTDKDDYNDTHVHVHNLTKNVNQEALQTWFPTAKRVLVSKCARCCAMVAFPDIPDAEKCLIEHRDLVMENNKVTMDMMLWQGIKVLMTNGPVVEGQEPEYQHIYASLLQIVTQTSSCDPDTMTAIPQYTIRHGIKTSVKDKLPPAKQGKKRSVKDKPSPAKQGKKKSVKDKPSPAKQGKKKSVKDKPSPAKQGKKKSVKDKPSPAKQGKKRMTDDQEAVQPDRKQGTKDKSPAETSHVIKSNCIHISAEKIPMLTKAVRNKIEKKSKCALNIVGMNTPVIICFVKGPENMLAVARKMIKDITGILKYTIYLNLPIPSKVSRVKESLREINRMFDVKVFMSKVDLGAEIMVFKGTPDRAEFVRGLVKKYIDLEINTKAGYPGTLLDYLKANDPLQYHPPQQPPPPKPSMDTLQKSSHMPAHHPLSNMPPHQLWHMPPRPYLQQSLPFSNMLPNHPLFHMLARHQSAINRPPSIQIPPQLPPFGQPPVQLPPFGQPPVQLPPFVQSPAQLPPFVQPSAQLPPFVQPQAQLPPFEQPHVKLVEPDARLQKRPAPVSDTSQLSDREEQMRKEITAEILAKLAPKLAPAKVLAPVKPPATAMVPAPAMSNYDDIEYKYIELSRKRRQYDDDDSRERFEEKKRRRSPDLEHERTRILSFDNYEHEVQRQRWREDERRDGGYHSMREKDELEKSWRRPSFDDYEGKRERWHHPDEAYHARWEKDKFEDHFNQSPSSRQTSPPRSFMHRVPFPNLPAYYSRSVASPPQSAASPPPEKTYGGRRSRLSTGPEKKLESSSHSSSRSSKSSGNMPLDDLNFMAIIARAKEIHAQQQTK